MPLAGGCSGRSGAQFLRCHTSVAGVTLIEVLIAVLILSVGLIGLAGLQTAGLRNNSSAYHRTQATALANDMMDSIRGNRVAALNAGYVFSTASSCSSTDTQANQDCLSWKDSLEEFLPNGFGSVTCEGAPVICTVEVSWNDLRGASTKDPSKNLSIRMSTEI
jgi:type IV pilus assembly protein PilV